MLLLATRCRLSHPTPLVRHPGMNTLDNIVYTVPDLAAAKAVTRALLDVEPHTDQPYYVEFNVAGIEIALTPAGNRETRSVAHIRVPDLTIGLDEARQAGATVVDEPRDVGDGNLVATVRDPAGTLFGLIQRD